MSRLSKIKLVRQQDPHGCLVACMAMITGKPYDAVKEIYPKVSEYGLTHYDFLEWLSYEGFAVQLLYRWSRITGEQRKPWPLMPWAEAHICGVDGGLGGESTHGIVLLTDGTVLDPCHDAPRKFSDYPRCGYIAGIFDVGSHASS